MTYQLGVDLGSTKTAAAIWDGERSRPVQLGNRSAAVPSVVFLRDDGTLMFGEAAQRRADAKPNRAAREFKRRVGDPVPLWLAGTSFSAQQLMVRMLSWVLRRASELEGEAPATVVVTHPANWGPYKRESFVGALRDAGLDSARLIPEPVAAAIHFDSERRVAPGETVAIYDLGGGTFDAAVLRRDDTDFEILGIPGGIDSVGGLEFDEAVLGHVWAAIGGPPQNAEPARMAALRREVVAAKEYLSEDVSADIFVDLTEERRTVVIRRSELEELIRPLLGLTVESLERTFGRSGVTAADLAAVVLVGGSSRVPLVQEILRSRLGRPVVLNSQPQLAIALGAALSPASAASVEPMETLLPVDPPTEELPVLDPPTELLERFDEPVLADARPRRLLAGLSPVGLVLSLIGAGIAVVALVSGINAALSGSGRSGERQVVDPPSSTASGAPLPPATSQAALTLPTATVPTSARQSTSRPVTPPTTMRTRFPRPADPEPNPVRTTRPPIRTTNPPDPEPTIPETTIPELTIEPTAPADDALLGGVVGPDGRL
jgi:actin-like ATPase involved in cell morphogenesis